MLDPISGLILAIGPSVSHKFTLGFYPMPAQEIGNKSFHLSPSPADPIAPIAVLLRNSAPLDHHSIVTKNRVKMKYATSIARMKPVIHAKMRTIGRCRVASSHKAIAMAPASMRTDNKVSCQMNIPG